MHKRKKIKVKNILKLLLVILLIAITIIFVKSIMRENLTINIDNDTYFIGDEYNISYTATYKDEDVTDKINVIDNVDKEKIGEYENIYVYNDGKREHKISKVIYVKDNKAPEIILKGSDTFTVIINTPYNEPGYTVVDEYDGDLTDKVVVEGTVDTTKEGEYILKYIVEDSSGNKNVSKRKVTVSSKNPMSMSVKEFSLNGFFTDTILKQTEVADNNYYLDTVYLGDSTALYYVMNKMIYGKQLWHKEGLSIAKAEEQIIYINHITSGMTFKEAMAKNKPKRALIMLGTNSASMDVDYFASTYEKFLKGLKEASPDTDIIVQSIFPVAKKLDDQGSTLNNDKINKMNYKLVEVCSKLGIPFLNTAEVLKDSNGTLKDGYYRTDASEYGVHLTNEGNKVAMDYFENHVYNK